MKTENTFIVHPSSREQENALKAFVKALNIKFEVAKEKPYSRDFVKKIQDSRKQVEKGETVKIALDEIWKE